MYPCAVAPLELPWEGGGSSKGCRLGRSFSASGTLASVPTALLDTHPTQSLGPWLSPSHPGVECVHLGPTCVSRDSWLLLGVEGPFGLAKALKARPLERHSREPRWGCTFSGEQPLLALD